MVLAFAVTGKAKKALGLKIGGYNLALSLYLGFLAFYLDEGCNLFRILLRERRKSLKDIPQKLEEEVEYIQ